MEFTTALGRLLHDSALRAAFIANPTAVAESLGLKASDQATLAHITPGDLEFQAKILLRKRYDTVRKLLPETIERLGKRAWPIFFEYARTSWPSENPTQQNEALEFCKLIQKTEPANVSQSEINRVRFSTRRVLAAIHYVTDRKIRNCPRRCVQILLRRREIWLYLSL